jgi:hypothetical protein
VFEKIDGSEVIDGVEVLSAIFTEFPPDLIEKITVASEITKFTGINLETIQKFLVDTKARHEAFTVEDAKSDIQSDDKFYELLKLAISDNKITVSISDFINSAGEEDAEVATTEEEQPQTEEPKEEPIEEESTEEPQEEPKEETKDDEEEVKESKVYIIVNTEGKTFNLVSEEFGRRCKDSVIESIHRLPYSLPSASVRVDEGTTISYFESELSDKPVATVKSFKTTKKLTEYFHPETISLESGDIHVEMALDKSREYMIYTISGFHLDIGNNYTDDHFVKFLHEQRPDIIEYVRTKVGSDDEIVFQYTGKFGTHEDIFVGVDFFDFVHSVERG